jgi:AmmeMemoRadiSam system protein B/AmmeMemoRadiSam system protein A
MRTGMGVLLGVTMVATTLTAEVRRPAVAGAFYPGDRATLQAEVGGFLRAAPKGGLAPLAVIVPHAGYVYSGATAGRAFAPLAGATVTRVILLGPSHYSGHAGGALPDPRITAFSTPLGEMPIDRAVADRLRAQSEFGGPGRAHDQEHCLEVELPFLQATVGAVPIVPILVGPGTSRELTVRMARALAEVIEPGTLIVASSDFTHHGAAYGHAPFGHDRDVGARLVRLGRATAERAAALDARGFWQQVEASDDSVCGARPITVLLELLGHAFEGGGTVTDVTTSGDVSGNWSQVVTYAAVSFTGAWHGWRDADVPAPLGDLTGAERTALLQLARATLGSHLNHDESLADWFAGHAVTGNLATPAGTFVTVHNTGARARRDGRLRGCIGVMEASEPLVDAVIHAATSAAHDPRFPELEAAELAGVSLEVSVLSPMRPVPTPEQIEMGRHGVVLSKGGHRAVFLPQVATETGWDRDRFLSQLALKAGLSAEAWREGARFEVFTAQVFGEEE